MRRIVVPITPNTDLTDWMAEWQFEPTEMIVIVDGPDEYPLEFQGNLEGAKIYNWDDIDKDLGKNSWIKPRKGAAVRSYGYYKAWQDNPDIIMTLDQDCFPTDTCFITEHEKALKKTGEHPAWVATGQRPTRGIPYLNSNRVMPIALNHGMWEGVPDEDAAQKMVMGRMTEAVLPWTVEEETIIPKGYFYPMCGMNLAWQSWLTPAMYFGLQGPKYPYDRFDDIWAGLFSKRIIDHLGYCVRSGTPIVDHRHTGDILKNFVKEAPGIPVNEELWKFFDKFGLEPETSLTESCYALRWVFNQYHKHTDNGYWDELFRAYELWLNLFKE